jgi:hypothetical protein
MTTNELAEPETNNKTVIFAKNTIEVIKDLDQIKSFLPTSVDVNKISIIFQIGTLISSISRITGFNPLILVIFGILCKIVLSMHLKKAINKYNAINSIETLTIQIWGLPINVTSENPRPQFLEYLSIVNYLKLKKIQKTQYIADYAGEFNFLNNLTDIKINNLISFSSTYSTNGAKTLINCSIILSSKDICALKAFLKKCIIIYKKTMEYKISHPL